MQNETNADGSPFDVCAARSVLSHLFLERASVTRLMTMPEFPNINLSPSFTFSSVSRLSRLCTQTEYVYKAEWGSKTNAEASDFTVKYHLCPLRCSTRKYGLKYSQMKVK